MSTLTGQQIKNTYQGLLKLADSTTGITSSFQSIQDGLGNDTGLRIATNQLEGPGIPSFVPLKAQYYGSGFLNLAGAQYSSGMQNTIIATPFYDGGEYSYSAISFNTQTITSTSDTVEMAIYTTQMINPAGLYPYAPIISGITADTTSTGLKTFTFPSHISMSGYGGGVYWVVYKISNSGVQPTWRPGAGLGAGVLNSFATTIYGITQQAASLTFNTSPIRYNNGGSSFQHFSGLSTFDNPFANNIDTLQNSSTTLNGNPLGFILHTVDY